MIRHDMLEFDVESFLDCSEKEECDILRRLEASNQEFRSRVAAIVESYLEQEKVNVRRCEEDAELISQLHNIKKDTATKLDSIVLAQKVEMKKMDIEVKQQAKLREDIEEAKSRKESISLEMVDLDQVLKDGKKIRKDQWTAIKKACSLYKENLNVHIEYTSHQDHERVKVTFFLSNNPDKDNYYVNLSHHKNCWKVGQLKPSLSEHHLEEIKTLVDITKPLDAQDVILYLCKLRNIFSKHYFK